MLPSLTQRALMLLSALLGACAWHWVCRGLQPGDGAGKWLSVHPDPGLSGPWMWIVLGLAGLPALAAAALVAAAGNPLSAVASLTLAGVFAASGYGFSDVVRRADDHQQLESLYPGRGLELLAWSAVVVAVAWALEFVRPRLRPRLGRRLTSRHTAEGVSLWGVDAKAWIAALVTAGLGAVTTFVLVRSADTGQVAGALVAGFALAAVIGHSVAPTKRPGLVLLTPLVVVAAGYVWAAQHYFGADAPAPTGDRFLAAFYRGDLPGLVVVLPVHAATAGVLGCAVGLGVGQVIEKSKPA